MELKAKLDKPYTSEQRVAFIAHIANPNSYSLIETEAALEAWGYTEEEKQQQEQERIAMLHLTRGDVFRGLLQAKGVTRAQIRALIEAMPDSTQEQALAKEMALIDFDEALEFYRGVALIDVIGAQLGISADQMTLFFETGDWQSLNSTQPFPNSENPEESESESEEQE